MLGGQDKAIAFVERVIDPEFAISAMADDGDALLGIAGFKTADGAMVGGSFADLAATLGWFGAIWRGVLLSLLERDVEVGALLMDGIAVAPQARGMGIGSALLDAIAEHARELGLAQVRLDVIDTNPRARALYLRKGFVPVGTERLGPLRHLFGFSSSEKLLLEL